MASTRDLSRASVESLGLLMNIASAGQHLWRPQEAGAVLRHLLDASLQPLLAAGHAPNVPRLMNAAARLGLRTIRDLLHHPSPPVELLRASKQFAKACIDHSDNPVPKEVAFMLYYASIVAARLRCNCRITSLPDTTLSEGLHWALRQTWLDDETRALIAAGLENFTGQTV